MRHTFSKWLRLHRATAIAIVNLLIIANVIAQNTVIITDTALQGGKTYHWTADKEYILDGLVFLESGGVLIIDSGTVIKGKAVPSNGDYTSALIITSGAKIYANGSPKKPIIFTAEVDDPTDPYDLNHMDRGLWGGLIILGDAPIGNQTVPAQIEGIPSTEPRAQFGGNNPDHDAGSLRYVSIRHGGAELSPGNEINGLTLGGVGSKTKIEYVEIFAGSDDGIEIFGGNVNIKHVVMAFCGDDGLDWDMGWRGKGQFIFVIQGDDIADNGAECDGAIPDNHPRYSSPVIYNATFIGSGSDAPSSVKNSHAILMRDATAGIWANSVFYDYANKALQVEDLPSGSGTDSYDRLLNGEIRFLNNVFYKFGNYSTFDANPSTGIIAYTPGGDDTTCAALIDSLLANNNEMTAPLLTSISRLPNNKLDPRPLPNSPLLYNIATYPSDSFFTPVNYRGAFDTSDLWIAYWTALAQYGYLPQQFVLSTPRISTQNNIIIINSENYIIIRSTTDDNIENVYVYDSSGKQLYSKVKVNMPELQISKNQYPPVVFIRVTTNKGNYFITKVLNN